MNRKPTPNALLHQAKRNKKDEFYTQLCDIERELQHYAPHFTDKVVYCNCDDPRYSNFVRYFVENFRNLGLRKLICSCMERIDHATKDSLVDSQSAHGNYWEYTGIQDFPPSSAQLIPLAGDGDLRSQECLELLQQADLVVTNPRFSLFREVVSLLTQYEKQYLLIGNINCITYKDIFSLIQQNRAWLGINMGRGISGFIVPSSYDLYGTEVQRNEDGLAIVATNNCLWLTNLDHHQRRQRIPLTRSYAETRTAYPQYDNSPAINVNKTCDIPHDYWGMMGVPLTFLHKFNPEQFEIVRFRKGDDGKDLTIQGKTPYFRILIRRLS